MLDPHRKQPTLRRRPPPPFRGTLIMADIKPKAKTEGRICVLFKENLLSSLLLAILPGTMDTAVHTTGKIKGSLKRDLLSSRRNFPDAVITQLPEAAPSLHPSMIETQQLLPPNGIKLAPLTHGLLSSPLGSRRYHQ